jgi:hypothetical protein
VDWQGQTPVDLLALMSKAGRRNTAVDAEWIATAGSATAWDPLPRFIHIKGPEDRTAVARVLDQWVPVSILGDRTWVHVEGRSKVEIQRGLFEAKTTASSGPQLHFLVDELAPGGALELTEPALASVDLSNPGDVEEVYLLGPGAEVIDSWPVASLPIEVEIAPTAWVIAVAEGNTSWAMTSPIWLERP